MKRLWPLLLLVAGTAHATFPTGATHCWLMNESSNTTRVDSIGSVSLTDANSNVGNAVGVFGQAANFTDTIGQYLQGSSNVTLAVPYSVSVWINSSNFTPPSGVDYLFSGSDGSSLYPASTGIVEAYDSGGHFFYWSGLSLSAGTIYNFVLTVDGSYNSILYVNGVSAGTNSGTNSANMTISGFGNTDNYHYSATLSEQNVATWNRVLNSTEVSAIYNSGTGISCAGGGGGSPTPNNSGMWIRGGKTKISGGETRIK